MAWLNREQIKSIGFKFVGKDVLLSDKASFYNAPNISIGERSRIDDFCIISAGSGGINVGCNVHISAMTSLVGKETITLEDFSGLSNKIAVFSSTDDFSKGMSNPTIPDEYRCLIHKPVKLCKHALVGSNSVLLPGSLIPEGASVGALSVIRGELKPWTVYFGNPARRIGDRSKNALEFEKSYLKSIGCV